MNTLLQKYSAALIQFLIVLGGAFQIMLPQITADEAWQLVAIAAGAVATFFLPLSQGPWKAALKTSASVLAAIAVTIIPFVVPGGDFNGASLVIVVLAALNAVASELGVNLRLDGVRTALANPAVPNATVIASDPSAVAAVTGPEPSLAN